MPTARTTTRKKPVQDMTLPNRNNRFLSIVSLVTPFILMPIVGIITGHVALKEYSKEGADQTWKPLALAGTIAGYAVLFVKINIILFVGAVLSSYSGHHGYYNDMPMYISDNSGYASDYNGQIMEPMSGGMMGGTINGSTGIDENGQIVFVDGVPLADGASQ